MMLYAFISHTAVLNIVLHLVYVHVPVCWQCKTSLLSALPSFVQLCIRKLVLLCVFVSLSPLPSFVCVRV
eukprot:m.42532 g.42532  ORF g.42532 m.42532 type:complete len:70 (-) comp10704_c0_seq1:251-460(-)